ncbi:hypothetical protein J2858_001360 [Neorhizobium galegae]|uniref:DUF3833 family protein n=1 Tax=Rhizobium/Agrobacterium group TaxID=227290 RepID=UPI001AE8D446|nr:DUF3833 family protein [Neorhizobium galegae]MBP2548467.1 hypothetical protein [Neorhizobium galegae]
MKTALVSLTMGLSMVTLTQTAEAADLVFERYFAGRTTATGSFGAINGVRRDFKVDLDGRWNGKTLVLREDFVFSDGEKDTKTWRFTKTGEGRYSGTREDVIGSTDVVIEGKVAKFTYLVNLGTAAKPNTVRFHDTMVLQPDGRVINTAWVTKYLFPVAKTRVVFSR